MLLYWTGFMGDLLYVTLGSIKMVHFDAISMQQAQNHPFI